MRFVFVWGSTGLLLLLLFSACGEPDSAPSHTPDEKRREVEAGPVTYEVQVEHERICSLGRVLVNGFPVDKWGGQAVHQTYDFSINKALIGEEDVLTIENEPCFSSSGKGLSLGPVKMNASVKGRETALISEGQIRKVQVDSAYREWTDRAQAQWAEYVSSAGTGGEALDSIRAWASRNPLTVSTTFDNEAGPDFSRIFEEAPVIEDTSRLKDYAMHLRDLMAKKDTTDLYREAKPLFTDRDTGEPASSERILEAIGNNWFSQNWRLDFTREDVGLRRWSGGRVWELYQKEEGEDFFVGGEAGATVLDVYVAELNGELKVVR